MRYEIYVEAAKNRGPSPEKLQISVYDEGHGQRINVPATGDLTILGAQQLGHALLGIAYELLQKAKD